MSTTATTDVKILIEHETCGRCGRTFKPCDMSDRDRTICKRCDVETHKQWELDATLDEMADLQKHFAALYRKTGLSGVSEKDVHLNSEAFFEYFGNNYLELDRAPYDGDYPYQYKASHKGVEFFCIMKDRYEP